ncbi:MAG: hypothetical protein BWY31_01145 [Lentisphaerae bacterium ADurb.Bin242]|nr:MAG: hypothetical protein BWY31_01145 [Lentisphaerae bacterium ADurb.Bin242]
MKPFVYDSSAILFAVLMTAPLNGNDAAAQWEGQDGKAAQFSAVSEGVLEARGKNIYVFSRTYYPLKKDTQYTLSGEFRLPAGVQKMSPFYFGIAFYDQNKKWMHGMESCPVIGTETVLTAPANKGDRTIKVKDASKWRKQVSVTAFGIQPDGGDLPNRAISPGITNIVRQGDIWEISFRRPLSAAYPNGTTVRQQTGGPYYYTAANQPLTGNWQKILRNRIQPWTGAAYARIVIIGVIGRNSDLAVKNIQFQEMQ